MSEQPEQKRNIRETNALVRALVEQETLGYPFWIGGIVAKYYLSDFGHIYFELQDNDHSIYCMIREQVRGTLDFNVGHGMEIEVYGTVRVYEKTARVQIEVERVRLIESLKAIDVSAIDQLKAKQLWPKTKRPPSTRISKIGLITSKQSEALRDFEDTYRSEQGTAAIKVVDVRLQGQQAPREIADAISRLNRENSVDVIGLIRGGGRAAELAVFNDILIAEAICRSAIPVITGIGHQRDDTLADQVADISTITPTAAASYLAKLKPEVQTQETRRSRTTLYIVLALIGMVIVAALLILLLAPK